MNTANTSNGEIASMTNVSCQPLTKAIVTPAMNVAKNLCNKKNIKLNQIKLSRINTLMQKQLPNSCSEFITNACLLREYIFFINNIHTHA